MAQMLVLEFSTPRAAELYREIGSTIGMSSEGMEEYPPGGISHMAGVSGEDMVVVELWESREAQEEFMSTRLGPAMARASSPVGPAKTGWYECMGSWSTEGSLSPV